MGKVAFQGRSIINWGTFVRSSQTWGRNIGIGTTEGTLAILAIGAIDTNLSLAFFHHPLEGIDHEAGDEVY